MIIYNHITTDLNERKAKINQINTWIQKLAFGTAFMAISHTGRNESHGTRSPDANRLAETFHPN